MVPTRFVDMGIHRRLCFASFHIGLNNFYKSHRVSTARVAVGSDRSDYGYTVYHKLTRLDPLAPAYRTRVTAPKSIASGTVKL